MKCMGFLISFLCLGHVYAQNITVQNVKVSITADSSGAAREQALDKAHDLAFQKLLEENFPEKRASLPSHNDILNMVSDFSIDKEKSSSTNYTALLTFQFDEAKVQAWLQNQTSLGSSSTHLSMTSGKPLKIKASYHTLGEWTQIKKTLETLPQIQKVSYLAVSSQNAEMNVILNGNREDLKRELHQKGFAVISEDQEWSLSFVKSSL
jgi:hypothetical protein